MEFSGLYTHRWFNKVQVRYIELEKVVKFAELNKEAVSLRLEARLSIGSNATLLFIK